MYVGASQIGIGMPMAIWSFRKWDIQTPELDSKNGLIKLAITVIYIFFFYKKHWYLIKVFMVDA